MKRLLLYLPLALLGVLGLVAWCYLPTAVQTLVLATTFGGLSGVLWIDQAHAWWMSRHASSASTRSAYAFIMRKSWLWLAIFTVTFAILAWSAWVEVTSL